MALDGLIIKNTVELRFNAEFRAGVNTYRAYLLRWSASGSGGSDGPVTARKAVPDTVTPVTELGTATASSPATEVGG